MPVVFDVAYLAFILLASPWLLWNVLRHGKYRDGLVEKWLGRVPRRTGRHPCVWFHAVSVGEVNLLQPLLDRWASALPEWECVISTTTKTGYELARRKYAGHLVFYCPLDFSWAVRHAMRRVRPDLLVLAELELWPNLIRAARGSGCRVAVVNGRLSEKSYRGYRRIWPIVADVLSRVDLVAAQNDEYAARFRQLGAAQNRVHVTGSVKFDGVLTDRENPATARLRKLAGIASGDVVFLAGSTQAPEEDLAVAAFLQLYERHPDLRLILVPRHPARSDDIAGMLDRQAVAWQRRSELDRGSVDAGARILLVDTIGELAAWWGTARIAFVGGSLGSRGGQNMIEPAGFGAAVCFGPNTRNFRDVVQLLLNNQGAVVVPDGQAVVSFVARCLTEPQWAMALGRRAQGLVKTQQGAADRTIQLLRSMVETSPAAARRPAA